MSVLNRIAAFWRNLFRKGDVEQELSDELAYALDALVEKKIAEGLSEVEARRQAAIELGGVEQLKEKVREAKAGYYMEGVMCGTPGGCFSKIPASQLSPLLRSRSA
jgi:hypothetical protein